MAGQCRLDAFDSEWGPGAESYEHSIEPWDSIKEKEFVKYLCDC
jgi:hypothetical protein